ASRSHGRRLEQRDRRPQPRVVEPNPGSQRIRLEFFRTWRELSEAGHPPGRAPVQLPEEGEGPVPAAAGFLAEPDGRRARIRSDDYREEEGKGMTNAF